MPYHKKIIHENLNYICMKIFVQSLLMRDSCFGTSNVNTNIAQSQSFLYKCGLKCNSFPMTKPNNHSYVSLCNRIMQNIRKKLKRKAYNIC